MTTISLSLRPLVQELTHEQFYELCMANKDIAMERSSTGDLIIMPPVGGESGAKEAEYIIDLYQIRLQGYPYLIEKSLIYIIFS